MKKDFTNEQWAGGILVGANSKDGGYPKICNTDGWVSVAGYTVDTKAKINGEVKMFTVYFTPIKNTGADTTTFEIASEENASKYTSPSCSSGYDPTGLTVGSNKHGAGWVVTNTASDSDMGNFAFNTDAYVAPSFKSTLVNMTALAIVLNQADGNAVTKVENEQIENEQGTMISYSGPAIDYRNTAAVYTVKSMPTPSDSSFPQIDWQYELVTPNNGVDELSDFLTIVQITDTELKVKIPDGYEKDKPAVIKVTATTRQPGAGGSKLSTSMNIIVKKFDAPKSLVITQKDGLTDATMIYTSLADETEVKKFTVTFPGVTAAMNFNNTAVTWKLMDKDRNEIKNTDLNAKAVLENVSSANGAVNPTSSSYSPPSATIAPVHTTFGEDYLILYVESAYDPSIHDEIKIKNHFKATQMEFSQANVIMATESSMDLSKLLRIGPENDYYETDLEWTYVPANPISTSNPSGGPYYITNNGDGTISSLEASGDNEEKIVVTDNISGISASIKIKVISLTSDIKQNDIHVENLLGDQADYVEIKGLEVGDTIRILKTYSVDISSEDKIKEAISKHELLEFRNLTAAQTPSFKFPTPNFLGSKGGQIAVSLERTKTEGDGSTRVIQDKVPVNYDNEPSKVYGYVRLAGKSNTSGQNAGIAIQLSGLSSPDVVYTDNKGYFEFKTYIIPGNYTMTITKENYLKRVIQPDAATGYAGLTIGRADEFAISTYEDPILIYPGDINADGGINTTDIQLYVSNWLGQSNVSLENFSKYDFYDGAEQVIDLNDLDLVTRRNGWVRDNYPTWATPGV